jgi:hypothetical protein
MRKLMVVCVAVCSLAIPAQALASIEGLDPSSPGTPTAAADALAAEPAQVSGASLPEFPFEGPSLTSTPIGVGNSSANPAPKTLVGFPTQGTTYAILTTGEIATIASQLTNESEETTTEYAEQQTPLGVDRGPAANDWTVLKVNVNVPGGDDCLALDYRFLSEEFPEFVGSEFNDAFIAEIDSTSWSVGEGGEITRPNDFAASPEGAPVSVNGVGPTAVTAAEAEGTYFDAATGLITTKTPITPGAHSLYFSIFDASDHKYDSAVFLDNLRFINESPATCKPPTTKQLAVPPAGSPPPPSNAFTVGSSVKFTGSKATLTVQVPGPGTLTATGPGGASTSTAARLSIAKKHHKKKPLILPASVHAAAAGPVKITIGLSAAGVAKLRKHGKLTVPVKLTFTPDGGTAASKTQTVTFKKKKSHPKK